MGLLLKSLSRIDSLQPATAIDPIEEPLHGATKPEAGRGKIAPAATAVPLEFEASTVCVAARPAGPATPLAIDTSTICLTVSTDEPAAPFSNEPISLEALFAVPSPSDATDGARAPAVALAPTPMLRTSLQTAPSDFATALDRLEQLQQTLVEDFAHAEAPQHDPFPNTPQSIPLAPATLRPEYRELRDHLLSRFPLTTNYSFLVVDAGRAPLDHTWLLPLAVGLLDSIANRQARLLLVEVDPRAIGIVQMLGIDASSCTADRVGDPATLSNLIGHTYHPQIDILRLGDGFLAVIGTRLEEIWAEFQKSYNLIFVASGPLVADAKGQRGNLANHFARSLLPLADAVILSVELGSTPVSVASQTADLLKAAGANLLGCVVQAGAAAE